jgi:CRISPR/Cas system-associated exonuclease Cas4 (RecB family)
MTRTLTELRAQPHVSVSQLKTFLQCPRKYNLQYIQRAEPSFRSAALAFGSAWHATIDEWLLRSTSEASVHADGLKQLFADELHREVARDGPPVLFDHEDEDLGQMIGVGRRMLDVFVRAMSVPDRVVGIEIPFGLSLCDGLTGEAIRVPLIGAMDAVVEERGASVVLELKTSRRRWSSDQLAFDPQPSAYRIAARELGYNAEVVVVVTTKSSRPEVQRTVAERGPADDADLFAMVSSLIRAVDAGVDHPVRGWQCRSCAFAGACR